MLVNQNISLKPYHTFGIDVKTKYFVEVHHIKEIEEALAFQKQNHLELLILGGGSNLLFTKDFDGIVMKIALKGIAKIKEDEDFVWVKAAAGENWHEFVLFCIENGWGGVENLSLIPGTVGAAPMQNIGAYGVEIKEIFDYLEAYHLQSNEIQCFTNKQCKFGYRESIFKNEVKGQYLITSVVFKLSKKHTLNISYGDIQQILTKNNEEPSINNISQAVIEIRSSKLPNPKEIGNAGSFFKNPFVEKIHFEKLKSLYPQMPVYPVNEELVKVPAGWLIEQCGWKGYKNGDAGVHAKQALVLVNYGSATGKEIRDLSEEIKHSVLKKFGIALHTEVNIV
ncbi:MAG: UDP-N-acetylmuramate dehydrogenase [Raineya sp.]|jgi:UDP-N-acetylmuramate dehydrogenase|nr:UDP-N-acetylmuramate dehydrogenase [Raineya sp.]